MIVPQNVRAYRKRHSALHPFEITNLNQITSLAIKQQDVGSTFHEISPNYLTLLQAR